MSINTKIGLGSKPGSIFDRINERAAVAKADHAARLSLLARQALRRQGLAVQDRDEADWWKHAHYWFAGAEGVVHRSTEQLAFSSMIDTLLPMRDDGADVVAAYAAPELAVPPRPLPHIVPVEQLAQQRVAKKTDHTPAVPDWSKASVPVLRSSRHRRKIASRLEIS